MNIIYRIWKRFRFRKTVKRDESSNVVDSMVLARRLYKELSVKAHPDRNPNRQAEAEDLMQRIVANRFNYSALVALKQEVSEKLK
jgi:hypothetical protein